MFFFNRILWNLKKQRVYILEINVTQFTVDIIYICVVKERYSKKKKTEGRWGV
jgi:hypothetical protein